MNNQIAKIVKAAITEDMPFGDITTEYVIPATDESKVYLVARESGVMAGQDFISATFKYLNNQVKTNILIKDSERFNVGEVIAEIIGPSRAILSGERVCLNLVQRACGIATLTAKYVEAAKRGSEHAKIVDTRKTVPGLRVLDKTAVLAGGGRNHRYCLSDAVMLKDNHLAVLTKNGFRLSESLKKLRSRLPHTMHIEVEIDSLAQLEEVLAGGADTILLDNFSLAELSEAVEIISGRAVTEASGGITLETVAKIASTGVDVISVGALTHSVRCLDLALDSNC